MPSNEQIDNLVVKSFSRIHVEGAEWTFRDDVKQQAEELAAKEGFLGETRTFRIGSTLLRLVGGEPGPFLNKRRYVQLTPGDLYSALTRLHEDNKLESRNEPRETWPDLRKRRKQYSLTYMHPVYGHPEHRQ